MTHSIIKTDNYLLVVDDSEIAIGDTVLVDCSELEVLDIRKVNDYYNEQFLFEGNGQIHMDYCKKIISHLPLNNSPILKGVDLLPPLEDDIIGKPLDNYIRERHNQDECVGFIDGYNKAKEKYKYTEEDVMKAYDFGSNALLGVSKNSLIQSLQQPKMPVGFKCKTDCCYRCIEGLDECNPNLLTTTNSQGFTQWVGEWIY